MAKVRRWIKILIFSAMLSSLFACAHETPKHETAGQYLDDSVITTKVKAALFDEMALKTFKIGVTTYHGVVQLSGFVDNADQAKRAEQVARGVDGVQDVKNDIIVK
jgi:osmotically-inducible protein OsmY